MAEAIEDTEFASLHRLRTTASAVALVVASAVAQVGFTLTAAGTNSRNVDPGSFLF